MSITPPPDDPTPVGGSVARRVAARAARWCLVILLSLFVVHTYVRIYDPPVGWTKMIFFGRHFAPVALPVLGQTSHYVDPSPGDDDGYDGQFYAQVALEPSLRDPALSAALDVPAYRARRIGLPFLAFCLGWGSPWHVLQAYALANLFFWFVLLGACSVLLKPQTAQHWMCLSVGMLSFGVIASMRMALVDLPTAALIFAGLALGARGGYGVLAGALLTRETSLLAVLAFPDLRRLREAGGWKRAAVLVSLTILPLAAWMFYVTYRFGQVRGTTGGGNFALPLQAMIARFAQGVQQCAEIGADKIFRNWWSFVWLYHNFALHELLTVAAIFFQGVYLVLRRDLHCVLWRTGVCYLALCVVLGASVWADTSAAARVLLPMTLCFYLRLARERAAWFWPFFLLGSLSVPFAIFQFWLWRATP